MNGLHVLTERYFPCPYERGGPVLVTLGVLSALLYVFTSIWYEGKFEKLPQNLMLLTFLISAWGQRRQLKSDLVFKLLALAVVIPWILFGINALTDYDTAVKYLAAKDLLYLFLFLPLAWWTGGSWLGARRMLAIAFLGLVTAVALDPNLMQSLNLLWSGQRVDFEIHNAQHGALFFGLVLIFSLCSFILRKPDEPVSKQVNALLLVAGLIAIAGLAGTQTRAAFISLVMCGLVALAQVIRSRRKPDPAGISWAKGLLVVAVVTGLLSWSASQHLSGRNEVENSTIQILLTGNLEELPFTSIGIRIHSWAESLQWIAERPITGWGRHARVDVIRQAEGFPAWIRDNYGHLHNGYLEILLGFGAVGFIYLCVLWGVLLSRIKHAAERDLYAFALYSSVFFLAFNMFESFLIKSSGVFSISLFMAAGYSQYLATTLAEAPQPQQPAAAAR